MQSTLRVPSAPLAIASRSLSLLHLGTTLGAEIVDVVERMHGTIVRVPAPLARAESDRTQGITRIVYSAVRTGFHAASSLCGSAARATTGWSDDPPEGEAWIRVRAAINGVYGNTLDSVRSPLAEPMKIVGGRGEGKTLVLFLHGLCMSELGWERGEHREFVGWCAKELGAQTAHVRYNTGRGIPENGRDLASLLEDHVAVEAPDRLILIGHSMGGLLIRSAREVAEHRGYAWPRRLTHVATLGTPYLGAPAERVGNWANGLLRVSPYTRPLSRLGDLRSQGIQDLRHGLVPAGSARRASGPAFREKRDRRKVQNLFIAATRSPEVPDPVWRGQDDLLVPIASALGLAEDPSRRIEPRDVRRHVVANTDHLELMGSAEVYAEIRGWLRRSSAP